MVRHYRLLKGMGGTGSTFLVQGPEVTPEQRSLEVLKELNPEMAADPYQAQAQFEQEARILRSLHHPGIPRLVDYFIENRRQYLVMDWVQGQDLEQWVTQRGVVSPQQAIAWAIQICNLLSYLHQQQPALIHRDLKPSNLVIRTRDQQVFLVDFGVTFVVGASARTGLAVAGYSAPEQQIGQPLPQSDLYSLGATLVFLLTGTHPSQYCRDYGRGVRIELGAVSSIPPDLRQVITTATHPYPQERYANAGELATALQGCRH
jgi:serine/threonine-protein kinase